MGKESRLEVGDAVLDGKRLIQEFATFSQLAKMYHKHDNFERTNERSSSLHR